MEAPTSHPLRLPSGSEWTFITLNQSVAVQEPQSLALAKPLVVGNEIQGIPGISASSSPSAFIWIMEAICAEEWKILEAVWDSLPGACRREITLQWFHFPWKGIEG